ncbi:Uncharacterised protein [Cytobacillus firmus]|nr:Uncharacterised protein [Cytobacillus firmus]
MTFYNDPKLSTLVVLKLTDSLTKTKGKLSLLPEHSYTST